MTLGKILFIFICDFVLNFIKRLIATQLHGNSTLSRFSANCPHWLRRFYHARPVTKQEYHYHYYRLSPYQKLFDIYSNCLSLPQQNKMLLIKQHLFCRILAQFYCGSCLCKNNSNVLDKISILLSKCNRGFNPLYLTTDIFLAFERVSIKIFLKFFSDSISYIFNR